mmetsp:Transcript_4726/g.12632  ORF Transcript_4726/g.12632 Transcript_4726/m.12632 type:complete len:248 (-) Transcript_4726:292-1035(-)
MRPALGNDERVALAEGLQVWVTPRELLLKGCPEPQPVDGATQHWAACGVPVLARTSRNADAEAECPRHEHEEQHETAVFQRQLLHLWVRVGVQDDSKRWTADHDHEDVGDHEDEVSAPSRAAAGVKLDRLALPCLQRHRSRRAVLSILTAEERADSFVDGHGCRQLIECLLIRHKRQHGLGRQHQGQLINHLGAARQSDERIHPWPCLLQDVGASREVVKAGEGLGKVDSAVPLHVNEAGELLLSER